MIVSLYLVLQLASAAEMLGKVAQLMASTATVSKERLPMDAGQ